MKKIFTSVLIFLLIVLSFKCIYATSGHYKVSINKVTDKALPGEEFKIIVAISDFVDVGDGINAVTGKISYNSKILEVKSVETASGWDSLNSSSLKTDYQPTNAESAQWTSLTENDRIISFATTGNRTKSNFNLLTITFKILDTAIVGDIANIRILYLDLANDEDFEEEVLPTLSIKVEKQSSEPEYSDTFLNNDVLKAKTQIINNLMKNRINCRRVQIKAGKMKIYVYVPIINLQNYVSKKTYANGFHF